MSGAREKNTMAGWGASGQRPFRRKARQGHGSGGWAGKTHKEDGRKLQSMMVGHIPLIQTGGVAQIDIRVASGWDQRDSHLLLRTDGQGLEKKKGASKKT